MPSLKLRFPNKVAQPYTNTVYLTVCKRKSSTPCSCVLSIANVTMVFIVSQWRLCKMIWYEAIDFNVYFDSGSFFTEWKFYDVFFYDVFFYGIKFYGEKILRVSFFTCVLFYGIKFYEEKFLRIVFLRFKKKPHWFIEVK